MPAFWNALDRDIRTALRFVTLSVNGAVLFTAPAVGWVEGWVAWAASLVGVLLWIGAARVIQLRFSRPATE